MSGCVLRGSRVVIPTAVRAEALALVHEGHRGIVAMKACARSYLWWPGIDNDIEQAVKTCIPCQQFRRAPPNATLPEWPRATQPWEVIHADFAGPLHGVTFLVVVDSFSKWVEVRKMTTIQSGALIRELRGLFATFGVPAKLVTDNGPSFVSQATEDFLRKNGVAHVTGAPYHPATNGQAERMVYELKQALARSTDGDVECRLSRFLLKQHTSVSTVTGRTPAMLMFGRELPTALNRLPPKEQEERTTPPEMDETPFRAQQDVFVRNHLGTPAWIPGKLIDPVGCRSWNVQTASGTVRRHLDHIRQGVPGAFKEAESSDMTLPPSLVIPVLDEPLRRAPCELVMDSGPGTISEAPTSTVAPSGELSQDPDCDTGDGTAEAPPFQRPQRLRQPPRRFPDDV